MQRLARAQDTRGGFGLSTVAAVLGGLVYANALNNPFVFDDHVTILENAPIRDLGSLVAIILHDVFRPVVNLSYALDRVVWGVRPLGFHLTSIVLHMANVALLFALSRRAAEDAGQESAAAAVPAVSPRALAFVTAGLFAVHPIMTEAVGYASGRAEVLCATFFLLGLLSMRSWVVRERPVWLIVALVIMAVGLLTKEVAAMLPFVFLAYDRLLLAGGSAEAWRRRLLRVHLPLALFVALAASLRLAAFFWVETPLRGVPPAEYLLMQPGVVWRYVGLLLAPVSQSVVHSVRSVASLAEAPVLLAAISIVLAGILALRLRRVAPLVTLGMVWFALVLAPTSLVPLWEPMAEHRVYLASAGFFLAIAAAVARGLAGLAARGIRWRPLATVGLGLVLGVLSVLTVARNRVWADPVTLWQDAATKAPTVWAPHYALGDALRDSGRCDEAIPAYQQAARLRPQERAIHTNLALCLIALGRHDEAYRALQAALRVDPHFALAHHNLGVAALLVGNVRQAERHFREAIVEDPRNVAARWHLATLYETTLGDPDQALRLCLEIRGIAPQTAGVEDCIRRNQEPSPPARPES